MAKRRKSLPELLKCNHCQAVTVHQAGGEYQCGCCTSTDVDRMQPVEGPSPGKHFVKCPGEAHGNPYIDNCSTCAPRWGLVEIPIGYETIQDYWNREEK